MRVAAQVWSVKAIQQLRTPVQAEVLLSTISAHTPAVMAPLALSWLGSLGPPRATSSAVTSVGGYTIHTFTSNGRFTPF